MTPLEFAGAAILGCLVALTGMAWLSLNVEESCPHCGSAVERGRACECTRPSRRGV